MSEVLLWSQLQNRLHEMANEIDGVVGVAVRDLATGRQVLINEAVEFSTASTIKIPILACLMAQSAAGKVSLADEIRVNPDMIVGGSGVLQHFKHSSTISVLDMASLMICLSDNTATNLLIDLVGMDEVNALLSSHGFIKTRLRRKMIDSVAAATGKENTSTPLELVRLLTMLYKGEFVSPKVCSETLAVLKQPKQGAMNRGLEGLPVEVANKPGGLDGVTVDAGIAYLPRRPFAMCVMANYTLLPGVVDQVGAMFRMAYDYQLVLSQSTRFGRKLPYQSLLPES